MGENRPPTWPLWLLAAPAGVAIWSGWVGLGGMTGFGPVDLLPGIGGGLHLNTAITLPVGMETYAAYALSVWLRGDLPQAARTFAKRSALSALVLGALGQIAYHLMAARHIARAPWWVTIVVACVPVAVLGMGAALAHLLHEPAAGPANQAVADPVWAGGPADPDPVPDPPVEPPAEPGSPGPEPAADPEPEPVVGRPRLNLVGQRRAKPRKVAGKATDPRAGQRVECGCGCGQMVSRMTRKRHEEKAAGSEEAG
jgi:hypothetical protein